MGEVLCPIDGCDYSADSVKSVECHIQATGDDDHAGSGRQYREELVTQKEADLNGESEASESEDAEASESEEEDAPEETAEGRPSIESSEKAEVEEGGSTPPLAAGAAAAPAAGLTFLSGSGDGEGKRMLLVGGVLLGLVLVWYLASQDSDPEQPEEASIETSQSEPATPTEAAEQRGGLSG
jgi:hypothetical protein